MNHAIFALELCLELAPDSELWSELRALVAEHPAISSPGKKWQMLRSAVQILVANQDAFVRGCWDFFDDNERALKDYDMWCNGMITREGARKEASGAPRRHGEPRFMTFTMSFLMDAGSQCARDVAKLCEVPENLLWKKQTFVKILSGLGVMNFAAVKSDVFYVIPGDESWGLTAEDLTDRKFQYLRMIEDR
ncbi:MAG: hypothetical protein DIJKHBIC_04319 [Thermoanaerobaculia bacterium]|nr:hypothetical protein [Thermoanaerobaculia bacterium]